MYLIFRNLISGFIYGSPDLYKFLDDARGNLTPEEALKIALSVAIERG